MGGNNWKWMMQMLPVFILIHLSYGLYELEVYRMLGYEQNESWVGSKVQSFTMVAAHFAAMIRFEEINEETLESLYLRKPGGILIILPKKFSNVDIEAQIWELVYEYVGTRSVNMPVYFAWEDSFLLDLYESLQRVGDEMRNEYQVQVSGAEPKGVQPINLEDYYCLFDDFSTIRWNNPSLMIVVGVDTKLPSGELQVPLQRQGMEMVLFFKLARSMKSLYQQYANRDQNIIFYVCTSSSLEYDGLQQFFNKPENQRIANTVENIIVLDQIVQNGQQLVEYELSQYYTQVESNEKLVRLLDIFNQTAQGLNYPIQLVKSDKRNILKNRDINVVRLKTRQQKYLTFLSNSEGESIQKLHDYLLEIILKLSYSIPQAHIDKLINDDLLFQESIYEFLNASYRHVSNLQRDSRFNLDLHQILQGQFKLAQRQNYVYKSRKFYTSVPTKASVIRFISAFLDLYIFCAVSAWLVVLFLLTKNLDLIRNVNEFKPVSQKSVGRSQSPNLQKKHNR